MFVNFIKFLLSYTLLAVVSELRRNNCEQTNDRFINDLVMLG
jgi:hypothetical protein